MSGLPGLANALSRESRHRTTAQPLEAGVSIGVLGRRLVTQGGHPSLGDRKLCAEDHGGGHRG